MPPTARSFASREVGLMVDQGHHERARVTLGRAADQRPDEPEVYLDGIRMELAIKTDGGAWVAWLGRALRKRVPVADELFSIVPDDRLQAGLATLELDFERLEAQAAPDVVLELLQLYLEKLLEAERDVQALALLEAGSLPAAVTRQPALRQLVAATLGACMFSDPDRSIETAARVGLWAGEDGDGAAGVSDGAAVVARAAAWQAASAKHLADLPPALRAFMRLGLAARRPRATALLGQLSREVAADEDRYREVCERIAARCPALGQELVEALIATARYAGAGPEATAVDEDRMRLGRRIKDAVAHSRQGALGALGRLGALRGMLAPRLYAQRVRPRLVRAVLYHRCGWPTLRGALEDDGMPAELVAQAAGDLSLRLLATLAALHATLEPGRKNA